MRGWFVMVALSCGGALAQHDAHQHQHGGARAAAHEHGHGAENPAGTLLMSLASGTASNPQSWPMPMLGFAPGRWKLMWMGQAFVNATQQSGPRGGDKVYSANWTMLAAARSVGSRGSFFLRGMASLEPLTITNRRYPLLFQTGESAYGRPLTNGQHPHELFMELAAGYAHQVAKGAIVSVYYAPVGDAPLGPVAFPHRASAMELPQAALAHHWQDSTHIANQVLTGGFSLGRARIEVGGFHGAEPDENRWNIDYGPIDSWASRLWVFPARNWAAQVSAGRLHRPEAFHEDDVVRATASAHYTRRAADGMAWSSSFIWARNYKTVAKLATHAAVAETAVPIGRKHVLTGRFEWSQRDELFEDDHELAHQLERQTGRRAFDIAAYTAGYTRDVAIFRSVQTGIGGNFSVYGIPDALAPYYGDRPFGVNVFLRVRLRAQE
jgi:hypothetical protein